MQKKEMGLFSKRPKTTILMMIFLIGCSFDPDVEEESWIDKPVPEWPDFALTNEISFEDTTFTDVINSFLVDTGKDTIGVSTKHIFMVFDGRFEINAIDLGNQFQYWNMYPKNHQEKIIKTNRLINADPNESIGQFNTLKVRDWIIFELENIRDDVYPLKIRFEPVEKNEIVYAVGWRHIQEDNEHLAVTEHTCFRQMGNYYYVQNSATDVSPEGSSGSPVIDKNGYLVGIASGVEGKLGVFGSVSYLKELFDRYGIEYEKTYAAY